MVRIAIATVTIIARIMENNPNVMATTELVSLDVKIVTMVISVICAVNNTINISIVHALMDYVSMGAKMAL